MFPELLLYSYHQKQCVMEKTDGNTVKYIYIATTERHEKKGIYKVGYTTRDASEKRSPELSMYAPFSDSIYEMKRIYEANDTDGNPDNVFRNWVKAKHNICTMTPEEIMQVFNWTKEQFEKYHPTELYQNISLNELDGMIREFLGIDIPENTVKTNWCIPSSRTPYGMADRMTESLTDVEATFFDLSVNKGLKICDFACKDASFVNALLDKMFMYNVDSIKSKSKKSTKSLIENILSEHIFAYCLDSEYDNIMKGVKRHISYSPKIYGKIDGNKLDDKIFRNFTVEYMEEYSRETMNNKLEMLSHNGRRFDAVVMNPPYSTTGGGNLHLEFTKAALEIADNVVSLFPFSFIYGKNKHYDPYKTAFDGRLISVEETSSNIFAGTNMQNLGVYNFTNNNDGVISVIDLSGITKITNSLSGLDSFKKNESELVAAVRNAGSVDVALLRRDERALPKSVRDNNTNLSIDDARKIKSRIIADNMSPRFTAGRTCLVVSASNGNMDGKIITASSGQICSDHDALEDMLVSAPARDYRGIFVNSDKAAKNLKFACGRQFIRFLIYRMQRSQNITSDVVKIIPDIDWSDPKVKTDQGILELCGMAPDRAKYWADYCADKIYQVDHGKQI